MPEDATHIKWAWGGIAVAAATMRFLSIDLQTIIICGGLILFFTMYWSPDLDITCKAYYRWGFLKIVLLPFVKIFSHRGISHHPILGPIALTIYFTMVVAVFNWIFMQLWLPIILPVIDRAQDMHTQITTLSPTSETIGVVLMMIACLWYAAWVHYLADYTS